MRISLFYHCADTLACKQFYQYRVRYASVYDYRLFYTASDCLNAAVYLRYHAAGDDALVFEVRHFAESYLRDKCALVVLVPEKTHDIGHKNEVFRVHFRGYTGCSRISVDIVHFSVRTACDS